MKKAAPSGPAGSLGVAEDAPGVLYMVGSFMLGGTERHVLRVLEGLDRSRIRPFVATRTAGAIWHDRFLAMDVPCFDLALAARVVDPRYLPKMLRLASFVRRNRIRIVHAYSWEMQMLALYLKLLCPGVVLIGTRRTVAELEQTHHLAAYRRTNRFFRKIVAVSETARRSAIEAEGIPPEQIIAIPNGIDVGALPERRVPPPGGSFRIGTVANVKRRKGYFWAVEALAELAKTGRHFEYHAIGRADTGDELLRHAEGLGLAGRVVMHGEVEDPAPLVAGLHAFFFPTYHEGMSNALLEAMAIGVPVLATDIPGNRDLIRDGVEGRLVVPEDRAGAAHHLEWMAAHPAEREALGRAARERVLAEFTLARMISRMESLYDEMLR